MRINVNGQPRFVREGTTLQDLLPAARGVAAALNGAVVPAASWEATQLAEGDAVELVTAHQGG